MCKNNLTNHKQHHDYKPKFIARVLCVWCCVRDKCQYMAMLGHVSVNVNESENTRFSYEKWLQDYLHKDS